MSASDLVVSSAPSTRTRTHGVCALCLTKEPAQVLVSSPERNLMKCAGCSVAFLDPRPDVDELSAMLAHSYIQDDARLEHAFEKTRDPVLSRVAAGIRARQPAGRILDVGCAGGYFLGQYFSLGSWDLFGVEPSKFASARAAAKGIKIYTGQLLNVSLPSKFFDVITLFDTLSYFREPQRELRILRETMKKGGLLVIEQPLSETHLWRQATGLGRLLGGAPMSLLECGQSFLYNLKSMSFLLEEAGFEILESEPLPGVKQRQRFRNALFVSYYWTSRLAWWISGRGHMWGPNFVVYASPAPDR